MELLIHVGIDTVNLNGQYFHPMKKTGDEVKKGDVLLTFEKEKIEQEYDLMTPVIISNTNRYQEIKAVKTGKANVLDSILTIR